jgi:hypothetical protein
LELNGYIFLGAYVMSKGFFPIKVAYCSNDFNRFLCGRDC